MASAPRCRARSCRAFRGPAGAAWSVARFTVRRTVSEVRILHTRDAAKSADYRDADSAPQSPAKNPQDTAMRASIYCCISPLLPFRCGRGRSVDEGISLKYALMALDLWLSLKQGVFEGYSGTRLSRSGDVVLGRGEKSSGTLAAEKVPAAAGEGGWLRWRHHEELIVGLDIGTTKVCAIIGECQRDRASWRSSVSAPPFTRPAPRRGNQHRVHREVDPERGGVRRVDVGARGAAACHRGVARRPYRGNQLPAASWPSRGRTVRSPRRTSTG